MQPAISSYNSAVVNSRIEVTPTMKHSCCIPQRRKEPNVVRPTFVFERGETSGTLTDKCIPAYEPPLAEGLLLLTSQLLFDYHISF